MSRKPIVGPWLLAIWIISACTAKPDPVTAIEAKVHTLMQSPNCTGEPFNRVSLTITGYDVQTTDSLVSPYIGLIAGTLIYPPNDFGVSHAEFKATYAWQEDRWVFKNIEGTHIPAFGNVLSLGESGAEYPLTLCFDQ